MAQTTPPSFLTAHFQFLATEMTDVMVMLSEGGIIQDISPSCHQMLGHEREELIGRNFIYLLHPANQSAAELFLADLDDVITPNAQWRLRHRIGYHLWCIIKYKKMAGSRILLIHDVTERTEMEEQLRDEQLQTRLLNDSHTDLVTRHTIEGHLLFASPALQVLLGYEPENLLGQSFYELIHPEERQRLFKYFSETVNTTEMATITYRIRHKLGHHVWFDTRARLIAESPTQATIIAISRDITQLKQTQSRLRQQTHQLVALERLGRIVTATLDLEEVLKLLLERLSPMFSAETTSVLLARDNVFVFESVFGLLSSQMKGVRLSQDEPAIRRLIETHKPVMINENAFRDSPANVAPVDWHSLLMAPLIVGNELIGIIGGTHRKPFAFTMEDRQLLDLVSHWAAIAIYNAQLFTHSRQRGEQLKQLSRKLVEVQEAERSRLSRELHDESGQALTALRIHLSILRDDISRLSEEHAEQLDDALELISDTMNRLSQLAKAMRPAGLDRVGLATALDSLCRDFAHHTRLIVQFEGDQVDLPESLKITLYRFVQEALTNVGKHAEATVVAVELRRDVDEVTVSVEDNGKGLPTLDFEKLSRHGKSLGLLGMQERLEVFEGHLEIISSINSGSTLIAHIPIERTEDA